MEYIQSLCDSEDANIFFGTVVNPEMEGTVRVTVLATGFNPYTSEGRKVAQATFAQPAFGQPTEAAPVAGGAVVEATPAAVPVASSADVVAKARERVTMNRAAPMDASAVFDESDLDIPAFIREHRQR
jgi:cell division protein FtsZ